MKSEGQKKFLASKKKSARKKARREYQRIWQENYRKILAKQGLKQIRIIVHKSFEAEIRDIARRDIENRR